MVKITDYTLIASQVNSLIDQGFSMPYSEVKYHCENKTIFDELEKRFPDELDLSLYSPGYKEKEKEEMLEKLQDIALVGRERRYWGVTNEGLNLLLGYLIGSIQHLASDVS